MSRLIRCLLRGLIRSIAVAALIVVVVGIPLAIVAFVGNPLPSIGQMRDAWRSGRIDDDTLLDIGTTLFLALWAWFSCTVVAEASVVLRWRSGGGVVLAPPSPSPSSWMRHLVRVALLSSAVVSSSGVGVISTVGFADASANHLHAARAAMVMPPHIAAASVHAGVDVASPASRGSSGAESLVASGRDTPYSIAARLGNVHLRGRIIDLNRGRPSPTGGAWSSGLFPAGMEVFLPTRSATGEDAHIVEAGDSYWQIAEDRLVIMVDAPTNPSAVLALTEALVEHNAPLLGHTDPTLLLPGEQVVFPSVTAIAPEPAVDDALPAPAATPAAAPAPDVPATTVPATTLPTTLPAPATTLPAPATTLPAPLPTPPAETVVVADAFDVERILTRRPLSASIGSVMLLGAGALGLLESRRRHQLRHAPIGARVEAPTPSDVATERALRALDATERTVRLDLALRSAAHHLRATRAYVVAAMLHADGELDLLIDGPAGDTAEPWLAARHLAALTRWTLPAAASSLDLADSARQAGQPCPALVQVGELLADGSGDSEVGQCFVDLEAVGLLCVDGPADEAAAIVRAMAASLVASPLGDTVRVITHGLDMTTHLGSLNAESAGSLDDALDLAAASLGSTAAATTRERTFALRSTGVGGEAWEPSVVVSAGGAPTDDLTRDLVELTSGGGRGLAVVIDRPLDGATWTLRAGDAGWRLDPLGIEVRAAGLTHERVRAVHDLLDAAERPLDTPDVIDLRRADRDYLATATPHATFAERPWALMVTLLGPVSVVDRDARHVTFERSKAIELVAWLSEHRERPTRAAARTALWDLDVRDATFANVVSEARRAMARAVAPDDGEEWIARTLTAQLPLHPLVVSDAQLLRDRFEASAGLAPHDAVEVLRPGVELIADIPFAGVGYLWPDAEGTTSSLILLATGAAAELARHYLAAGDIDGVFWATGQGLRVLAGHEELIALRMRAYAHRGDLAGVRSEWDVYERALTADPWSTAEPSPKLVAIRHELLHSA